MQSIEEKKIKRLQAIVEEVQQFHPILKKLLPKIPSIKSYEYTHGTSENGADFVLERLETGLEITTYVGVIVKCGNIAKAELPSISSQIEQCEMQRHYQGGKKKIILSEIWILTNGTISPSAQEFIHHKYASQKIIFIYRELLTKLFDSHFPSFWSDVEVEAGDYFQALMATIKNAEQASSLLPDIGSDFYIDQEVTRATEPGYVKFGNTNKGVSKVNVYDEIEDRRFILIEGDAGLGKSKFLRRIAMYYCQPINFNTTRTIPILATFKDLSSKHDFNAESLINHALAEHKELLNEPKNKFVILLDAADEVKISTTELVDRLRDLKSYTEKNDRYRIAVSSRVLSFDTEAKGRLNEIRRLELLPLSVTKVMEFIRLLCTQLSASNRIFEDLKRSQIFKDLPRSPISAILLAGLLKETTAQELPSTLPELYSKYFEIVLGRWEERKGLQSQKEYDILDAVLINISTYIIENELPKISIDEAKGFFRDYLKERNYSIKSDEFFDRICRRHQILIIDDATGCFGFKHRTFAEFLCAKGMLKREGVKITKGIFDLYWLNTFYFYVGLKRDCPEILDQIAALQPANEPQRFMKVFNTANFLMAAYATPYSSIKKCVINAATEAAHIYIDAAKTKNASVFKDLPEMRLLWLIQFMFKRNYSYNFLERAVTDAAIDIAAGDADEQVKAYSLFFLNVTHLSMGGQQQFDFLLKDNSEKLPLDIVLGVRHESEDLKRNALLRRMDQNLSKWLKGNTRLRKKIDEMYHTPVKDRVEETEALKN